MKGGGPIPIFLGSANFSLLSIEERAWRIGSTESSSLLAPSKTVTNSSLKVFAMTASLWLLSSDVVRLMTASIWTLICSGRGLLRTKIWALSRATHRYCAYVLGDDFKERADSVSRVMSVVLDCRDADLLRPPFLGVAAVWSILSARCDPVSLSSVAKFSSLRGWPDPDANWGLICSRLPGRPS